MLHLGSPHLKADNYFDAHSFIKGVMNAELKLATSQETG